MSHGFTFKGYDLSGPEYGLAVVSPRIQRLPQPRVAVDEFAQADGASTQGSTFGPRYLTLECAITAPTQADRITQMNNVIAVLALSQESPGDLEIHMVPGIVYKNARLVSAIDSDVSARMERFSLVFVCDPWPEASDATVGSGSTNASGTTSL